MDKLIIYTTSEFIICGANKNPPTFPNKINLGVSIINVLPMWLAKDQINEVISEIRKNDEVRVDAKKYTITVTVVFLSNIKHYAFIVEGNVLSDTALAKEYLENVIQYSPGYMYLKDNQFRYIMCNGNFAIAAGLSSPRDIIGKTDYELAWGKTEGDLFRQGDIETLSGVKKINFEEPQLQADGQTKTVLANKVPLYDNRNNIIGILGNYIDITDRKKLEEDLRIAKEAAEAAARAKTEFIANMSHDLRTPLAGVINASEILEHKAHSPEEKEFAEMIHESGSELLAFINGILDDSIADNVHEHEVVEGEVDLKNMLRVIEKLELPAIKTKHLEENDGRRIELKVEMEPEVPQVVITDGKKLERILLNLIGNAIKFTDQGSITVHIKQLSCEQQVSQIQFSVVDTGIGIPDEAQSQVFDEFFKVSPSSKGLYKGYGKGLAIAKKYVELLGGKITLVSHLGKGTAFYFTLSLKVAHQSKGEAIPQAAEQAVVPEGNKAMSLLVDDNHIALRCLETLITEAKYPSMSAGSAEEALALIKTHPFVCMVTDLGLPGLSGIELTQQVRAWEKEQNKRPMLIVGLSAAVDDATRETCLKAGMNEVFMKPITPDGLKKILKNISR